MIELSCFYTVSSPWAYFGGPRLQDMVRRHHVKLILKPFDFMEVVPKTGGIPLRTRPAARQDYHAQELDRWRRYLGMPLNLKPRFYPTVAKLPGFTVIAAQEAGLDAQRLSHALLRALWAEDRDLRDPAVRRAVAEENDMDGAALVAAETSEAVQARFAEYSAEAERLGVFGSPTLIVEGELFWGQDRYGFVDRALDARRARDQSPGAVPA